MRIDDYCNLGRTVPELSKKYGISVCSAGFSRELDQLVRLYPLPVYSGVKQRSVICAELVRPRHDNRKESWKLNRDGLAGGDGIINTVAEEKTESVIKWLIDHQSDSISQLNKERKSLGVIKVSQWEGLFVDRETKREVDPCQRELFEVLDDWRTMPNNPFQNGINKIPYLRFKDDTGWHKLQLREWGAYVWFGKEPNKYSQIWDNYLKGKDGGDLYLLVGNMCNYRTTWLVINMFPHKPATPTRGLFDDELHASESITLAQS